MLKRHRTIIGIAAPLIFAAAGAAFGQSDSPGCRDHPMFTRMDNFFIARCREEKFGQFEFRDARGKKLVVEGRVLRIDYNIKEGFTAPSGLQVIRNYENAIIKIGGVKLFQEDQYEIWLKLERDGKTFWAYVDSWHGGGKGETYGLTIVEQQTMAQEVVAEAKSLMSDLQAKGHASIYGIYFDFDSADIKPESEPAIREIAKLLRENEELKLYVVGHTDNVGSLDYNMKLSKARADAVTARLVAEHKIPPARLAAFGVGSLAPVASNRTDEGRAKNRRVELVEQ